MTDTIAMSAGAICDDLDDLLSQIDPTNVDAMSHLYVARRWLLEYLQRRPNQRVATANAELAAVEDALKRADEAISIEAMAVDEDSIDELVARVRSHREAIDASESKYVGWELKTAAEESSTARTNGPDETGLSDFERLEE